jgi:hypothetical protein
MKFQIIAILLLTVFSATIVGYISTAQSANAIPITRLTICDLRPHICALNPCIVNPDLCTPVIIDPRIQLDIPTGISNIGSPINIISPNLDESILITPLADGSVIVNKLSTEKLLNPNIVKSLNLNDNVTGNITR